MSNIKVEVTMPDSIYRMIEEGYDVIQPTSPTRPEVVAAFQEMVNLLGMLFSVRYGPDMNEVMYFKNMDENGATFGHGRVRTPEAESIGKGFLVLLQELTRTGYFERMLEDEVRRADDPGNDPGCDPGGGVTDPDDRDKGDPW
ncbi:hypothetical protein CN213_06020 [Sinorhizobium meliloti]|uniref:hypothetical protein n=1 Tax=Rhizobium meliloti TaxID=382 RepID=UPI000FD753F3|nr:hypothetical protein [Sinorhizobium meliloti]RVH60062.1 hypothetical protein CN213_06020 [Sinorhizobium meliloti]